MELLHKANIFIHLASGTIALILGLIALLTIKGSKQHNLVGRYFLRLIAFVILTGLIGVFVFERNTFLLVITVLSGYVSLSGYRVLKSKNNEVNKTDIALSIISLIVLAYFLYYFQSIGMIWSPIVIYSTVGALLFVLLYDFLRYFIPKEAYKRHRIWLYEHIYKMMSAFSALLSAFAGTVLEAYQPHSQYLPSALCMGIILGFMFYVYAYGLKRMSNMPRE
ncbi:MAG: hypothetical protein R8P61_35995 [Bacteroidia bacterium]|nr:hypothetical protein [Bacteroidia bacterium]